jgi:type VI protein secretion system component Hcp
MSSMNELIKVALDHATVAQLSVAIQQKLIHNEEVKIKPSWIRVQHVQHCDHLTSVDQIDAAFMRNPSRNVTTIRT